MRKIDKIIIHCSATKEDKDFKAKDIESWHIRRGFISIGYHYVIDIDGTIEQGRPEKTVGAHTIGQNGSSIGICYIGGLDINGEPKDTRTERQKMSMYDLIDEIQCEYKAKQGYKPTVHGHNEYAEKACPCFNVQKEYEQFNK